MIEETAGSRRDEAGAAPRSPGADGGSGGGGGVAPRYRREVAAGIRAALALASERDDLPWDAAAITPVV